MPTTTIVQRIHIVVQVLMAIPAISVEILFLIEGKPVDVLAVLATWLVCAVAVWLVFKLLGWIIFG